MSRLPRWRTFRLGGELGETPLNCHGSEKSAMSNADEFDDPERERAWIREQREVVLEYLDREQPSYNGVPERPAWFLAPYYAIWAVGSRKRPGAVGWWAISGDVPTDYMSSSEIRDARMAMRVFGLRWTKAARQMAAGEEPDDFRIGTRANWPELAPLLASRAKLLVEWADEDDMWS